MLIPNKIFHQLQCLMNRFKIPASDWGDRGGVKGGEAPGGWRVEGELAKSEWDGQYRREL